MAQGKQKRQQGREDTKMAKCIVILRKPLKSLNKECLAQMGAYGITLAALRRVDLMLGAPGRGCYSSLSKRYWWL